MVLFLRLFQLFRSLTEHPYFLAMEARFSPDLTLWYSAVVLAVEGAVVVEAVVLAGAEEVDEDEDGERIDKPWERNQE